MPRTSVKDVDQAEMVKQIAQFLKKSNKVKLPDSVDIIKTGKHKELAPLDPDWFYTRTAAIARRLYIRSPAGVGAFTKVFGGRKRNGTAPPHFCKAATGNIRKALQQLESIKWVSKTPEGDGRMLTKTGRKDLDRIASQIRHTEPKQEE